MRSIVEIEQIEDDINEHVIDWAHHVVDYVRDFDSLYILRKFMSFSHEDIGDYLLPNNTINPALGEQNTNILFALINLKKIVKETDLNLKAQSLNMAMSALGRCNFDALHKSFLMLYTTSWVFEHLSILIDLCRISFPRNFISKTITEKNLQRNDLSVFFEEVKRYYLNKASYAIAPTTPIFERFQNHLAEIANIPFSKNLNADLLNEFVLSEDLTVVNLKQLMFPLSGPAKKMLMNYLLTKNPEEVICQSLRPSTKDLNESAVQKLFPTSNDLKKGMELITFGCRAAIFKRLLKSPHIYHMHNNGEIDDLIKSYPKLPPTPTKTKKPSSQAQQSSLGNFGIFPPAQMLTKQDHRNQYTSLGNY